jgi:preprotein translocase subunit YajC
MTVGMVVILVVLIFFMFRSSRKRQKQQSELQKQVVPGAKVMTNFGVYGTILSIDDENNKVELETSPGHVLTVHRQTVGRVESVPETADESPAETVADEPRPTILNGEPLYGERVETDVEKSSKKSDE